MLRYFAIDRGRIVEGPEQDLSTGEHPINAQWIDALEPNEYERRALAHFLSDKLPQDQDVEEIESSARYFVDADGIHVHSLFLTPGERRQHDTRTVAFILQPERLITLREDDLADFRLLRLRARAGQTEVDSPQSLLVTIFEQKVENLADTVEDIHLELEKVSHNVLEDEDADYEHAIDALAKLEDSCGKIRLCLMDTQRSVSFVMRNLPTRAPERERDTARQIQSDIETLMSHITFLFEKINFLMDSTVSFINIEQSKIIKIFSIAAVVFLPPTAVASIYGMNFTHMPELAWQYGYPMAIALMIASGLAPYLYFKYKKWF